MLSEAPPNAVTRPLARDILKVQGCFFLNWDEVLKVSMVLLIAILFSPLIVAATFPNMLVHLFL